MKLHQLTAKQREYLIRLCHGLETCRPLKNAVMAALQRRGLATYADAGRGRMAWSATDAGKTLTDGV